MKDNENLVFGSIDRERVRGLLFDVDGTLSDTDDQMVASVTEFLKPVSWFFRDRDPHKFSRWIVTGAETPVNFMYSLADRLNIDGPLIRLHQKITQKSKAQPADHEPYLIIPGVKAMLEEVNEIFSLAVVSSRDGWTTKEFLKHFDLQSYFPVVVTSQTCQRTKPSPEPIHYAAEKLGLKAEQCVMVGDTIMDIRAGKAAGAQTVGVLCGFGTQIELMRAGADMILANTSVLPNYL
jgi:HAD superfamily hydrolase (TIGR01509 family)